jgi:hypothetical protein
LERKTPLRRDGDGARRFADQRSELKRSPLEGGSSLARTGRLKPRSEKRKKLYAEDRRPYVEALLAAGVGCELGPILAELGIRRRCAGRLEGLHERRKRSAGGSLTNRANLVPACNLCNGYLEDAVGADRELIEGCDALVVREGHPEYVRLGAKTDG